MSDLIYVLDASQRILQVGGRWDSEAAQNGAPETVSRKILGHSIWNFVQGAELRSYLNAVFFASRSRHASMALPYSFSVDGAVRDFEMRVTPLSYGALRVENTQLGDPVLMKDFVPPGTSAHCEMCLGPVAGGLDGHMSSGKVCSACKARASSLLARPTQTPLPGVAEEQPPSERITPLIRRM